jgi:hypothetical protein
MIDTKIDIIVSIACKMTLRIKTPNEKMLEKLIYDEERLRMSKEYQDQCTLVKDIPNGWLNVTKHIQEQVARDNGFDDELSCQITCNMMRRAHLLFPDNKFFSTVPVQVRNNKANMGTMRPGSRISQEIDLWDVSDNHPCSLFHLLDNNRPTIIFTGSQT